MLIDNSKIFRTADITRRVLLLAAALLVIALLFWEQLYSAGITSTTTAPGLFADIAIVIAAVAVLFLAYTEAIGLTYFSYSREKGVILIKYYRAKLFGGARKKIAIPENELVAAEIKTYYGGFQKELCLTRREQRGTASYPPVNVSFVLKRDKEAVVKDLQEIIVKYER